MTAAQKTAKLKFKQAIAYRQKTGVSLKEAFAHIYGKKVGAVKKKIIDVLKISDIKPGIEIINNNNPQWGSYKVDRKYDKGIWEISNNRGSRILDEAEAKFWKKLPSKLTFLSGQKKVGALPIGFKGNIFGVPFKIVNQYDIYNNVSAIMEDTDTGSIIVVFDGKGLASDKAKNIVSYVSNYLKIDEAAKKMINSRMLKFASNMQKEVKDFNAGKKTTIKKQPIIIPLPKTTKMPIKKKAAKKVIRKVVKKKAAPKKKAVKKIVRKKAAPKKIAKKKYTSKDYDKRFQALKPGKRVSDGKHYPYVKGNVYYENRENRMDRGKLLGIKIGNIPTYKDKDAAREIQLFADNDYMLYQQRKRPILINLGKKYKKGTYDVNKAAKLWRYYVDAALQKYHKEYGHRGNWYDMLNVPDRNLLSLDYAIETKNEFDLGNFTN